MALRRALASALPKLLSQGAPEMMAAPAALQGVKQSLGGGVLGGEQQHHGAEFGSFRSECAARRMQRHRGTHGVDTPCARRAGSTSAFPLIKVAPPQRLPLAPSPP
jgi:hypothetical protein